MYKTLGAIVLGFATTCNCLASNIMYEQDSSLYVEGMLNYNSLHYQHAETASFFGPQAIIAIDDSIDKQWGYGVGLGYHYNNYFRSDITFQWRPNIHYHVTDDAPETARGTFDNYQLMLNAYVSPQLHLIFNPYLLLGIGIAHNKTDNIFWDLANQTEFGKRNTDFAWQIGVGALFHVNKHFMINLNYALQSLGTVEHSGEYNAIALNNTPAFGAPTKFTQVYNHEFQFGFHYLFEF